MSTQEMKPKLKMPMGKEPHYDWWYPKSQGMQIPRRDSVGSESSDVGSPSSPTMPQNFSYPPRTHDHKPMIFKEFDFVH